jgi:flagellar export protein FliJ
MRRYRFRLEQVMRLRRAQEELQRTRVLLANQEKAKAELRLAAREREYGGLGRSSGPIPVSLFKAEELSFKLAAGALKEARHQVEVATEASHSEIDAWLAAKRAVMVLEHLDERRRVEHFLEEERREAVAMDEMATSRWWSEQEEAGSLPIDTILSERGSFGWEGPDATLSQGLPSHGSGSSSNAARSARGDAGRTFQGGAGPGGRRRPGPGRFASNLRSRKGER